MSDNKEKKKAGRKVEGMYNGVPTMRKDFIKLMVDLHNFDDELSGKLIVEEIEKYASTFGVKSLDNKDRLLRIHALYKEVKTAINKIIDEDKKKNHLDKFEPFGYKESSELRKNKEKGDVQLTNLINKLKTCPSVKKFKVELVNCEVIEKNNTV